MFGKIRDSIRKTKEGIFDGVVDLFKRGKLDDALYDELEELLIQSDMGIETTEFVLNSLKKKVKEESIKEHEKAKQVLQDILVDILNQFKAENSFLSKDKLTAILVVGVNGTGKTTSIAKLVNLWKNQGYVPIIGAADTFRAAAIDQIRIWGERLGVYVVSHQPGADPGAVVYDAFQAAQARKANILVIDTAGRLHTKFNLMEELKKISRILKKCSSDIKLEIFLVIDATTGQNAIVQAKQFLGTVGIDGLILTKLDGTAKGGVAFSIVRELGIPIKYVGTGEKVDDIAEFDPQEFVFGLLDNSD